MTERRADHRPRSPHAGLRIALLLAPALIVIGVLFVGGLADAVLQSFGFLPAAGMSSMDLHAWRAVLGDPVFLQSLLLTLYIAGTATIVSAALAIALALALRQGAARSARLWLHLPITVPHLLAAAGMSLLLAQSGLIARAAISLGLIDEARDFPPLVQDPYAIGIIVTYVWKETPFIALVALALLKGTHIELEQAARTLGATRWQSLRHVSLPAILPGVLAASFAAFAFAFGAFEVPLLLGESWPQTLPVLAWQEFSSLDLADRPKAMAIALTIALSTGLLALIPLRLARRFAQV